MVGKYKNGVKLAKKGCELKKMGGEVAKMMTEHEKPTQGFEQLQVVINSIRDEVSALSKSHKSFMERQHDDRISAKELNDLNKSLKNNVSRSVRLGIHLAAAIKQIDAIKERERKANEYKTTYTDEALRIATDRFLEKSKNIATWKEKIRISDGGKDDAFLDAVIEYLETLPDDNRRIEACTNIIKICRNNSVELQQAINF
jgi:hypothetical protein